MKDHELRELVNALTSTAREFAQTQQLRERIAGIVRPAIEHMATDTRRCIDARNRLNAAFHGEGAVIDDLERIVMLACRSIGREQALQAKIDALMLEYCPDEMTPEQRANWAAHQRPVDPKLQAEIEAAIGKP